MSGEYASRCCDHACCLTAPVAAALGASRKLSRYKFTSLIEELSAGMEAGEFKEFSDYLEASVKVPHCARVPSC